MIYITQDDLKKRLAYDPETGKFIWLRCPMNERFEGKEAGGTDAQGYRVISLYGCRFKAHRLAFLYMDGYLPEAESGEVDHINGDKIDNRWANLRIVSKAENMRNQHRSKKETHGVSRLGNGYVVQFKVSGKKKYFGYRGSFDAAIELAQQTKEELGLWET